MTSAPRPSPQDETLYDAASLAFAMLRFAGGAAHTDLSTTPPGVLRAGLDCYLFAPSWRHIPLADVPRFLADLPSPALLSSTTTRGVASLTLVDELSGERLAWAQKSIANQQEGLEVMVSQLKLADDARVLLQFDDEEHWHSLAVVRMWCARFGVYVGWNMRPYVDDARAAARLMLTRSDGQRSWGEVCPVRRRDPRPDAEAT